MAQLDPAPLSPRLRDLSPEQWKSGIAAWLGWLFDGLDMHLYVLVATPFVAELLRSTDKQEIGFYSSWIQAAFLIGWAFGGSFFGLVGDRLGRSRALMLTILTYAAFTGLSYFAQAWWHLLIFRFLAALGIGGEWAVGASLLSETWPKNWRPWLAAVLQTAVNLGVMLASMATYVLAEFEFPVRTVFLVGLLPAILVLWIRRGVPETAEWHAAQIQSGAARPGFLDLFRGQVRRITILTLLVCALTLTAHWAFLFWFPQHLRNLPEFQELDDSQKTVLVSKAMWLVVAVSIAGNFLASALARVLGYRRAIAFLCLGYFLALLATYVEARSAGELQYGYVAIGLCQGIFALFTMYLPPLFPTLLRTTGAGFCYNIGRIVAGLGTVVLGLYAEVGDYRLALVYASFLFLPATAIAWFMPDTSAQDAGSPTQPVE
jgi:MFS family permease